MLLTVFSFKVCDSLDLLGFVTVKYHGKT